MRLNPEVSQPLGAIAIGVVVWASWGALIAGLPVVLFQVLFRWLRPRADSWPAPTLIASVYFMFAVLGWVNADLHLHLLSATARRVVLQDSVAWFFGALLALVVGAILRRTRGGTGWKIAFAVMMLLLPAGRLVVRPTTSTQPLGGGGRTHRLAEPTTARHRSGGARRARSRHLLGWRTNSGCRTAHERRGMGNPGTLRTVPSPVVLDIGGDRNLSGNQRCQGPLGMETPVARRATAADAVDAAGITIDPPVVVGSTGHSATGYRAGALATHADVWSWDRRSRLAGFLGSGLRRDRSCFPLALGRSRGRPPVGSGVGPRAVYHRGPEGVAKHRS